MPIIAKSIPISNPSGAQIGFNNLLADSTTDAAKVALIPNTWERFRPSSGSLTVKFQTGADESVNFIGIAAHALAGETVLIQTAETVGGALTDVESITFADNGPVMVTFDARTIREVALVSTLISSTEIGVVSAGTFLEMPTNIYGGHSPITLSPVTEYQSNESESGQFLGENIIRKGLATSVSWQFLDDQFYRDEFKVFVDSARTLPFFLKWRPDFYSDEVAYGKVREDITPVNMGGGHRLMSVSFNIKAHADL